MQIRISVDDATLAPELVRRLEGLFDSPSVSFDPAHNEVKVESEWGSSAVGGVVGAVEAWLEEDGVPSATLSLGDRSHTLFGSSPLTVIH